MSACKCDQRARPVRERMWYVAMRGYNRFARNGYRRTPSAYSLLGCLACAAMWRTRAQYVASVPDALE